ncbi:hypothetical protein QBC33DRAFT_458518 [Phialemonium atrogriseum]|uniref:2EXR domain-containing protein n=1 Tax=Phialemonium atrogriseum TaxID=1093897 RepID=A0AAJ0FHY7_9PEZI|nr:uncharacterized protein QBC33DRAFT_458518 [Phialemonium atrogriseum]KAK1763828.1 hypothetical protein QBC33DRAFT_458518 [Phialemonium atrogriseum]
MDSSLPNNTFHKFPRLPPEIRRAIWELCLPCRVVEVDCPSPYITEPYRTCSFATTTTTNTRPPLISRVCCEAREVAFEHGSIYGSIYGSETEECSKVSSDPGYLYATVDAWIQPSVDTIHLNWMPAYNWTLEGWHDADPIPFFHWVADQTGAPAVSITAEMLLPFHDDWFKGGTQANTDAIIQLDCQREYIVALVMVSIHIPLDIAARSGLFGLLGDDRVKLVDPSDWVAIDKYMGLWTDHGSVDDKEAVAFKQLFSDRQAFQTRLERWKDDVAKVWVWHYWNHGMQIRQERPGHELPDRDAIWLGSNSWPDPWTQVPDPLTRVPFLFHPWFIDIEHRQLNADLPWVQRQKERMPTFHPKIMFRLCGRKCFLPRELRPRLGCKPAV